MTIHFGYNKKQVIQALRYHFITRPEIRIMLIVVNIFSIASFILYMTNMVSAMAFLVSSLLWAILMSSFWFIMPNLVYRRAETFKHEFTMDFLSDGFRLSHDKGSRFWEWRSLDTYKESPHFFHLYFDTRSFLLVPKSACETAEQEKELRTILNINTKGK
ncbi:YcxB family protein [Terrimonas rubra]|uniref:YcxB family protein n=1 Tax=Terrimonas rubra TaxID=1035890 RepID=A0ABW6A2J1_9BACT